MFCVRQFLGLTWQQEKGSVRVSSLRFQSPTDHHGSRLPCPNGKFLQGKAPSKDTQTYDSPLDAQMCLNTSFRAADFNMSKTISEEVLTPTIWINRL
jgi:hypothetical protein